MQHFNELVEDGEIRLGIRIPYDVEREISVDTAQYGCETHTQRVTGTELRERSRQRTHAVRPQQHEMLQPDFVAISRRTRAARAFAREQPFASWNEARQTDRERAPVYDRSVALASGENRFALFHECGLPFP